MLEPSAIAAAVFSDCGQASRGPSGVAAQSTASAAVAVGPTPTANGRIGLVAGGGEESVNPHPPLTPPPAANLPAPLALRKPAPVPVPVYRIRRLPHRRAPWPASRASCTRRSA